MGSVRRIGMTGTGSGGWFRRHKGRTTSIRGQSFQLFVVVFDTLLVWELLVLPSAAPNLPSVSDTSNTSDEPCEFLPLMSKFLSPHEMLMVGFPSVGDASVAAAAAKWLMGEAPRKDCWMSLAAAAAWVM